MKYIVMTTEDPVEFDIPPANICYQIGEYIFDEFSSPIETTFVLVEWLSSSFLILLTFQEKSILLGKKKNRIILAPKIKIETHISNMNAVLKESVGLALLITQKYTDMDFYVMGNYQNGLIAQHLSRILRIGGASFNSIGINDLSLKYHIEQKKNYCYDSLHPRFYNHILSEVDEEKKKLYFGNVLFHSPSYRNNNISNTKENDLKLHFIGPPFSSLDMCTHTSCNRRDEDPNYKHNCVIL